MGTPTYVLVHGGWGGAWCWRDLCEELDRRGADWRVMDLPSSRTGAPPSTDLDDDVRAVLAASEGIGTVVLVGHSYGGAVITEAAPHIEGLVRMVYVAALVPDLGESATTTSRAVRARTRLDESIVLDGEVLTLDPALARSALYGQCSHRLQDWALAQLSTQTLASFRSVRTAARVDVRSTYVKCLSDHAIDPALQELLATRCDTVVELDSDHSPFLSHPAELATAMLSGAGGDIPAN